MGVGVAPEHSPEERRACREDDFVGLDLLIITGKCDVKEVPLLPQLSKGDADVCLEVVPAQAEFFCTPHFTVLSLTPVRLPSLFCVSSEV